MPRLYRVPWTRRVDVPPGHTVYRVFVGPGTPFEPGTMPDLQVVQVRSAGVDWIVGKVPPGVTLARIGGHFDGAAVARSGDVARRSALWPPDGCAAGVFRPRRTDWSGDVAR